MTVRYLDISFCKGTVFFMTAAYQVVHGIQKLQLKWKVKVRHHKGGKKGPDPKREPHLPFFPVLRQRASQCRVWFFSLFSLYPLPSIFLDLTMQSGLFFLCEELPHSCSVVSVSSAYTVCRTQLWWAGRPHRWYHPQWPVPGAKAQRKTLGREGETQEQRLSLPLSVA